MRPTKISQALAVAAILATSNAFAQVEATGGSVVDIGGFRVHTFTSSGTFDVTVGGNVEVLVVAGGGGGGDSYYGGGGGAGGFDTDNAFAVSASSYTVTVGAGGAGANGSGSGSNGGNSIFDTITAVGGGGGGGGGFGGNPNSGSAGGSGGGANHYSADANGGTGTVGQGNDGGGSPSDGAGGGGGAGALGEDGPGVDGGDGGSGLSSSISGSSQDYAGGGGGGALGFPSVGTPGVGGSGGGGAGGIGATTPTSGAANTGGGGGGAGGYNHPITTHGPGADGGSGIVIVRYSLGLDNTPPIWVATWPQVDTVTTSSATARAQIDEDGTAYYVVVADGDPAPDSAEVKAGTGDGGAAALASGSIVLTASVEGTSAFSGLPDGTAYDVYFVAEDGFSNLQASPALVEFTTSADTTKPQILSLSPADEDSGVGAGSDLVLTFDEPVALTGSGTVTLRNLTLGPGSDVAIALSDPRVTVSGADLTISPTVDLAKLTDYAVQISNNAVEDQATSPNAFDGILDDTTWIFTTGTLVINVDIQGTGSGGSTVDYTGASANGPIASGTTWNHFTVGANPPNGDLLLDLDDDSGNPTTVDVTFGTGWLGSFADGAPNNLQGDRTFTSTDVTGDITISGLPPGGAYNIALITGVNASGGFSSDFDIDGTTLTATGVTGAGTNANGPLTFTDGVTHVLFSGIIADGSGDITFTMTNTAGAANGVLAGLQIQEAVGDTTAPEIATLDPADDASGVSTIADLVVTFDENVAFGTGDIRLRESGGALVEAFDVTGSPNLSLSGATVTIDPSSDLSSAADYYVEIASTAIDDLVGNSFAGISGPSTWNFTAVEIVLFDDFSSDPELATKWTEYDYLSPDLTTVTWNSGDGDLELSKPGSTPYNGLGLYRPGALRTATDPVTLTVKSLNRTSGGWGFLGLMISAIEQPDYLTTADDSYSFVLAATGGTNVQYEVRRTYQDGTGDFVLKSGGSFDLATNGPTTLDIVRNGAGDYEFLTDGVLFYTSGDVAGDTYDTAAKDSLVYFQIVQNGDGAVATTVDDFGIAPPTPASVFDSWAAANGLSGPGAETSADTEGGTGDGLNQLLELAFGTDPNANDNMALSVSDGSTFTPGTPIVQEIFNGGNPVKFRYVRRKDYVAAGLTYTPKFTDSTGTTIPDPASPTPTLISDAGGDYEVVEVSFPLFDSTGKKATGLIAVVEVTLAP